jgi:two-component system, sensor histidine kinase and response regulator
VNPNGTILLVDDDPEFIHSVAEMLQGEGYATVETDFGQPVLETYDRCQADLVLLGLGLQGHAGIETCRQLKARHGDSCAPVIFFASKSDQKTITEGFSAGAADYLTKPCHMKEVRARTRKHLQNRLLLKQQQQMVEQMSRANTAKHRFIGMAAHDMRNPLVTIRGFAEMLGDGTVGPMPTSQLALVSIIRATSQSMIDTLNELLDVATIESSEFKLNLTSFDLSVLVAKAVVMSRREAARKRSSVEMEWTEDRPVLTMDVDKIKQVADNLLSNAIKYSPPGSTIRVTIQSDQDGFWGFAVRDQGPGIPEAERHKIFQDFGSLSTQPTLNEKSTGVGLVICRRIVGAHGGTIRAENLPEGGCEFRVWLPINVPERPTPPA